MQFSLTPKAMVRGLIATSIVTALTMSAGVTHAQELRLAMSSPPTAMDPHFYNLFANINVSDHMFEQLVKMDPDSRVVPGLAESWRLVNDTTWEFKLRRGVKFHDGSELTAADIIWSLDRPATIQNSPGKFDVYTKAIVNKTVVDPYTIRLTTKEPYPLLLSDLTTIAIVSKKATEGLSSDDFNAGKGMIGTGPYKFVRFLRDDRVELERFEDYWDKKPAWTKVTLRFIPNGATRMAALLAGDVHAIENVPTPDLGRVRNDANISMFSKVSHRVIYLYADKMREQTPFVTDKDGKPLAKNPLQDRRVRQAISMSINREAIKDRVMEGLAEPTNQFVPPTLFGYHPGLKVMKYDVEGARKLMADAGYSNGFTMTIHTPNNRYVNDEKIVQTVAQMLSRIGIQAKVEGMPMSVYSGRGSKGEFSFGLLGWGAATGEVSSPLRALVACPDAERGFGGFNWTKYCNPEMTEVLAKAVNTVDDNARLKMLQQATEMIINDYALIPLHQQVTTWAARKGIGYTARTDERTYAFAFHPLSQ